MRTRESGKPSAVFQSAKKTCPIYTNRLEETPASIWAEGRDRTKPKLDCNLLAI
ncbi:hypothetical protein R3I94_008856 [Phoxinus phoxinus]